MDGTQLGITTAKLMEKIEGVYGEDAEIRDAIVIAEVGFKDDDGEDCSAIEWFCTSERSVIREGLIAIAHKSTPFEAEGSGEDDEEG